MCVYVISTAVSLKAVFEFACDAVELVKAVTTQVSYLNMEDSIYWVNNSA